MPKHETEVILWHDGDELAHVTLAEGEYIIGRDASAHISVDLPRIADLHARLTIAANEVLVEDLGSPDGTYLGDEQVTSATRVPPNQPVRLGDVQVEIRRPGKTAQLQPGPETVAPAAQRAIQRFLNAELAAQNRYRVGETVALGGMGAILSALEGPTKRTVAMKVMLGGTSERSVLRFISEAQVTAQLEHPNIVPVHEVGVDDRGQIYYTMKLVRGITLKKVLDLMADGVVPTIEKYPLAALLIIFQKVCDAIAFAHSRGVMHRDLKPENVMLDDFGVVLVMDWGLAKVVGRDDIADFSNGSSATPQPSIGSSRDPADASSSGSSPSTLMTLAGTVLGTPKYMSPEQARGEIKTLDSRCDVYSLGAILFQILYLRVPISGRRSEEVLLKVQRGEIQWPGNAFVSPHLPGRRVPESLVAVCRKALALDREHRYATISDLQADITAYQSGFATLAENAGAWKQLQLLIARHRALAAALVAMFFLSVFFSVNLIRERNHATDQAQRANDALTALKRSAPAFRQLADREANVLNFGPALAQLEAAMSLEPGRPADLWRRGHLLIGLERFGEAAATLRAAAKLDPTNARQAEIGVLLDRMEAGRPSERYAAELSWPVYDQLFTAGHNGEALALSRHLHLDAEKRLPLVQKLVAAAYPPEVATVTKTRIGRIAIEFSNRVSNLEGLRNVPFDILAVQSSGLKDLEPLRGLRPIDLNFINNPVTSIEPLRGMPLDVLRLTCSALTDIEPLRGMPLRKLQLEACPPTLDLTPLLECRQLETLVLTGPAKNVDALRRHPRLEHIGSWSFNQSTSEFGTVTDATEFWRERDRPK